MDKTKLTLAILRTIEGHPSSNPIRGRELAEIHSVNIRQVQDIVEMLRSSGFKVGSAMAPPAGYFLATDAEELLETAEHYRSRGRLFFATANRLLDFGRLQQTIWEQEVTE